jgi:hypothetical protein
VEVEKIPEERNTKLHFFKPQGGPRHFLGNATPKMGNVNVHVFNQSCSKFHAEQKVVRVTIRLAGVNGILSVLLVS